MWIEGRAIIDPASLILALCYESPVHTILNIVEPSDSCNFHIEAENYHASGKAIPVYISSSLALCPCSILARAWNTFFCS